MTTGSRGIHVTVPIRRAPFVDVLRNRYAQHAVPPYAVRPRPGAPVAAPLHWAKLDDAKLKADRWTIATLPERLEL